MAPKHRQTQKALLAVVCAVAGAQPDLPGWTLGDECSEAYPAPSETSAAPGPAGGTMACASVHDPTHVVATSDGHLAVFGSGQGRCGESIVVKYMAPGSNAWVRKAPLIYCGSESDGPEWIRRLRADVGDMDAPAVTYEAGATPAEDTWVLFSSKYVDAFDPPGSEESPATACVTRSVARGAIQDPRLAWTHDPRPVFCSNMRYDADGFPSGYRYETEAEYVAEVDDGFGIDPAVYSDGAATYMAWGSGVVGAVELDATGRVVPAALLADGSGPGKDAAGDPAYAVLSRGAGEPRAFSEAPYVYAHGGFYYLWVNWFACCAGSCSTYEIKVGRATSPTGPFVDDRGAAMGDASAAECAYGPDGPGACAGGTSFLAGDLETGVIGPGHAGVLAYDKGGETVRVFTFHYYDHADGGGAKLGARLLTFSADGWPVLGAYWDVCDFTGCDPSHVSTTCSESAEADDGYDEYYEDHDGPRTEAGDEIDPSVGLVVVVGDSLLDGTGSTRGAFEGTLAARLGTVVYNNAVGGADFGDIMSMRACSSYDACTKWAIADGGINGMDDVSMEDFVSRERAAGASTVIIGYPPTLRGASGPTYDAMMASFATLAAESDDVYFVDPRTHPIMGDPRDPESRPWRAEDNEHPSPRAGEWMANVAADYILGAGHDQDEEEEDNGDGGGPDQDAEEEDNEDAKEEDDDDFVFPDETESDSATPRAHSRLAAIALLLGRLG